MYVPMYHLLKKTRTLLDALKQDGRHLSKLKPTYKGLCGEDSAKQWSDTVMDTNDQWWWMDRSWDELANHTAGRSRDQLRTDNGGKRVCLWSYMCCSKMVLLLSHRQLHSHDPSLQRLYFTSSCSCNSTVHPGLFLIPSLHGYHQFWLLMVSPIICKKAELYVMMMMNYLWMIIDRHGRDELKPLSLFTSACRIKQTVKFSHRKCSFFFFNCISLNLDLFHIPLSFDNVFFKSSAR